MKQTTILTFLTVIVTVLLLEGCYHQGGPVAHDAYKLSERQIDSLSFFSTHHYTNNYNFVVKADSMVFIRQLPEEAIGGMVIDTFTVYKHDHLVVADIRPVPTDTIDSVWVQLANDRSQFGWAHESYLLAHVVPDDPISQFISTFSDNHLLVFLIIFVVISAGYMLRQLSRHHVQIVHFNDIDSFYPTLLCLIVASAATFYATIQNFAPEMWRHFYYHPTLNPFNVPMTLGVFLLSVWAMVIVSVACLDDVRHQLPFGSAVLYLGGLLCVCSINYIVFSITTLYYIGYFLLAVYFYIALRLYFKNHCVKYVCGRCGAPLKQKGRCPRCGAINE